MRVTGIAAGTLVAAVAVLAAACGGSDAPKRSAYADSLAALCRENVAALEAIGRTASPAELRLKLPRQIAQYRVFHRKAKLLRPTAAEKLIATRFVNAYGLWADGEDFANRAIQANNLNGFFQLQEGASVWLKRSEAEARKLGATECTVRPFEEAPPP